jgi:hypothetical protein
MPAHDRLREKYCCIPCKCGKIYTNTQTYLRIVYTLLHCSKTYVNKQTVGRLPGRSMSLRRVKVHQIIIAELMRICACRLTCYLIAGTTPWSDDADGHPNFFCREREHAVSCISNMHRAIHLHSTRSLTLFLEPLRCAKMLVLVHELRALCLQLQKYLPEQRYS